MTKLLTKAGIGLAAAGTLLATTVPADAQRYHRRHHDDTGAVIAAGIVGLALGAAISNDSRYDYDRRYYRSHGYYPTNGYYYRDNYRRYRGYQHCTVRRVYDRYEGRHVRVRYCR